MYRASQAIPNVLGRSPPVHTFECPDMADFAWFCKQSLVRCGYVLTITSIDKSERKRALTGHGFTVMTHPRINVRCVMTASFHNVASVSQKTCELYILFKSLSKRAEGFLPEFACQVHLYPDTGKRKLPAIWNVLSLTKIWGTSDWKHLSELEKSTSSLWPHISHRIHAKMGLIIYPFAGTRSLAFAAIKMGAQA